MRWIPYIIPVALVGASVAIWQMDSLPFDIPLKSAPPSNKRKSLSPQRTIFAAGIVEGTSRQAPLRFEISGRLVSLQVREGTRVRKGDSLAHLDDAILQQRLTEAKSKLLLARAERTRLINGNSTEARKLAKADAQLASVRLQQAKSELARVTKAYAQGVLTSEDYEKYKFRLKTAQAQWNRALAHVAETEAKVRSDELQIADAKVSLAATEVSRANVMLAKTILRAPANGIVLRIDAEPGEILGSENNHPVITFVDDSVIQVRAYVEELDALGLRIGQKSHVTADGLAGKRFAGKITWIAPSMHHKNVRHNKPGEHIDVKVREILIRIDDPKQLVIGLPVEVFVERASKTTAKKPKRKTAPSFRTKRPLASTGSSQPIREDR